MKVHRSNLITALDWAIGHWISPNAFVVREWKTMLEALRQGEPLEFYPDDVPVVLGDSKGIPLNN